MSHFVNIKTRITEREQLVAALQAVHLQYQANEREELVVCDYQSKETFNVQRPTFNSQLSTLNSQPSTIALAKVDRRFYLPAGTQVEGRQKAVVEKILKHCGLWKEESDWGLRPISDLKFQI